jgi:RNA polymerase sigma-70 factor (ECF subfamily)
MDDEALLAAVVAGDDRALHSLFERHAPWVASRLRRGLTATAVEDVVQETFIAVWRGAGAYHGGGAVGAWIWGIARRQAALWARKHGRAELEQSLDLTLAQPTFDDPALTATTRADLERALRELGPDGDAQRELVQLVFVEERPLADVAARLAIPEGTVKSRVFAVRRRLRAALGSGV